MDHVLGALLAQHTEQGQEQTVYYLSCTLIDAEHRYNPIEIECLVLVFTIKKMQYYVIGQTIHVIFWVNPLRLFIMKPRSLNCRLANWALLPSLYDIHFVPYKS